MNTGFLNLDGVEKCFMVLHTLRTCTTADRSQAHRSTTIPDDTVQQEERINSSHIDVLWGRVARKRHV